MFFALSLIFISCVISTSASADIGPILITGDESEGASTGTTASPVPFAIGDTAEGEFTGFREVIQKEQLQQAGGSLAEVVANGSGVQFKQSGGIGSHSTVSLRGSSAEQVNVYLDGILLNEASGGGVNLSDIELMQAEQVEVYKGTVPVQLGNTAIGGAINITTARSIGKPVSSMVMGVGSFGSSRFSAAFRGPATWLNDQTLVGSFSYRQSANDFPFLNDNGTNFNTADDLSERRNNAQTRSVSGFLKTGHKLGDYLQLEHALQVYDREQGVANWNNTARGAGQLSSDNVQWRSTLRHDAGVGSWSSLWELTGSIKNELFDDQKPVEESSQLVNSGTTVLGARGYWELIQKESSVSASVRLRSEALDSINDRVQVNSVSAKRQRADISVQRNRYFNSADSMLSLSLAAFIVDDQYNIENFAQARDDYQSSKLLPQLGFSHTLSDRWLLLANVSQQSRVPSFFELFGSQGIFVGNSSLQDELSNNVDIGLKWNSDPSQAVDRKLSASYFYSQREDLIVRTFNARGIGRSQNLASAVVSGLEFTAAAAWPAGFSLDAALTLQDAENRSLVSGSTGKQLPGEAEFDGALSAKWKSDQWKIQYEYKVSLNRHYDTANFLDAADQRLHNVSVSRYWKNWRLDVELNNLTDRNYEDFNGYPTPGRVGFVSVFYQP